MRGLGPPAQRGLRAYSLVLHFPLDLYKASAAMIFVKSRREKPSSPSEASPTERSCMLATHGLDDDEHAPLVHAIHLAGHGQGERDSPSVPLVPKYPTFTSLITRCYIIREQVVYSTRLEPRFNLFRRGKRAGERASGRASEKLLVVVLLHFRRQEHLHFHYRDRDITKARPSGRVSHLDLIKKRGSQWPWIRPGGHRNHTRRGLLWPFPPISSLAGISNCKVI